MIHVTTASQTLAMLRARGEVKDAIRRRGEKVTHYSAAQISRMAVSWLALHSDELMPTCVAQAHSMMLSGSLGRRAQKTALAQAPVCTLMPKQAKRLKGQANP